MAGRYRIGFENPGTASGITDHNPDLIPIVDMGTPFAFGDVVALVTTQEMAEKIVVFLNLERLK